MVSSGGRQRRQAAAAAHVGPSRGMHARMCRDMAASGAPPDP